VKQRPWHTQVCCSTQATNNAHNMLSQPTFRQAQAALDAFFWGQFAAEHNSPLTMSPKS
jgi:hypothetical protein